MLNSTIILYGLFAGIVAILVTVSIEKFGGLIGGVLGTVPSTIIPAAAGVYALEGDGALTASMSVVPIGMLINGMFLGVWIILPKYIANESLKLPLTVFLSLCTWAVLALISLIIARQVTNGMISELMLGMVGLALLAILSIMFNVKHRATPKGENKVPISILSLRGVAAGLAIAACLVLAEIGLPFVAGLASAFPAIFLTSMVALWLSQGPQVPQGAAAPMMLGGASVSVYALLAMWSLPSFGIIFGSAIAWFGAVILWTIPAFFALRKYHLGVD
tara:strand:+ start:376 stop:1203 length:828 start_codon:yes stop_codon:yes gene_type:complete